ncbi:MAG TPA: YbfB/YjiJ family MFS transporter [Deferrimonas sp.]|jgi:MFS family permease
MSRPSPHYAWVIAATGALTLFACLGLARFAFGMLLPGMRAGLGLGFDEMGFVSTGNFVGYLAAVAMVPALVRRFRPRALIAAGLLLIALCMLGIGLSRGFAAVLCLYALVGIGSGLANIPVMVLVSHWFRRERRGRAAGMMVMGNGAAIIFSGLLIPVLNRTFGDAGWRSGWLVLGVLTFLIAVLAACLLRNDPADLGLEPLGRREALSPQAMIPREAPGSARVLVTLGVLYLIFGATYMIYGTFFVTTLVVEYGFAEARAGLFWSWVGFFALFSGIAFGALSDRIGRRGGLAAGFAVQTLAYLLAGSGLGTFALLGSVVLYGLAAFAIPSIMAAAIGDYFGLTRAASAFSIVTFFFALGQTVGPGSAGVIAAATGTFTSGYLAAAGLTALALCLSALLPRPGALR